MKMLISPFSSFILTALFLSQNLEACSSDQKVVEIDKNSKFIVLIGLTDAGKSSIINSLFGPKPPVDVRLAQVCHNSSSTTSCTETAKFYKINNSSLGNIVLLDTRGFSETGGEEADFGDAWHDLFRTLFENKPDYVIDAVLYVEDAAIRYSYFDWHFNQFVKVFRVADVDSAMSSFIYGSSII